MDNKSRGILLVAVNHPHFFNLATNFTRTILASNPDVKIRLVYDDDAIYGKDISMFEELFYDTLKIDKSFYHYKGKKSFGFMKIRLDELSDFDTTLYIDVDSLWLPNKSTINEILDNIDLNGFNIAYYNNSFNPHDQANENRHHWVQFKEVKPFVNIHENATNVRGECQSTMIGWTANHNIWDHTTTIYERIYNLQSINRVWYGELPDELIFWLACMEIGSNIPVKNIADYIYFCTNATPLDKASALASSMVTFPNHTGNIRSNIVSFFNDVSRISAQRNSYKPLFWKRKDTLIPVEKLKDYDKVHKKVNYRITN